MNLLLTETKMENMIDRIRGVAEHPRNTERVPAGARFCMNCGQTLLTRTLDAMARGGMYDLLAGGFARYSVDAEWRIPHFEKMLYDNSQLARVYLHAWQVTGNEFFRTITEEILDYEVRDMLDEL